MMFMNKKIKAIKGKSIAQAFLVVTIWATSWVMIKLGLEDIPPVTFAGLRYFLAFLLLLPFVFQKKIRNEISRLSPKDWTNLILLGVFYYSINQGAIYAAIAFLPVMAVSLILSFTSIVTAGIASKTLDEKMTWIKWTGLLVNFIGAYLYFYPIQITASQLLGIGIAFVGVIGNSIGTIIGRKVNLSENISPITITTISMGIGSIVLLAGGILTERAPEFTYKSLVFLMIMVVINTAFAFYLWNTALKELQATEASIINNSIIVQIAILAWVFLGEKLSILDILGIILVFLGALLVQLRPNQRNGI